LNAVYAMAVATITKMETEFRRDKLKFIHALSVQRYN